MYRSEERNRALRLCGWPHNTEVSTLGPILEKLQVDGQISRGASLAIFHMKIRKAIKILTRSGQKQNDVSFQLVALALAGIILCFIQNVYSITDRLSSPNYFFFQGFTDNRDTLWQEMCGAQKNALTDPYLRAAFSFLTSPSEKYEAVLVNKLNCDLLHFYAN